MPAPPVARTGEGEGIEMKTFTVVGVWVQDEPVAVASLAGATGEDWVGARTEEGMAHFPRGVWVREVSADDHEAALEAATAEERPEGGDDEDDDGEHPPGDGCAIYDTGYRVRYEGSYVDIESLEPGDEFYDPAFGDFTRINEIVVVGDDVHVDGEDAD